MEIYCFVFHIGQLHWITTWHKVALNRAIYFEMQNRELMPKLGFIYDVKATLLGKKFAGSPRVSWWFPLAARMRMILFSHKNERMITARQHWMPLGIFISRFCRNGFVETFSAENRRIFKQCVCLCACDMHLGHISPYHHASLRAYLHLNEALGKPTNIQATLRSQPIQ